MYHHTVRALSWSKAHDMTYTSRPASVFNATTSLTWSKHEVMCCMIMRLCLHCTSRIFAWSQDLRRPIGAEFILRTPWWKGTLLLIAVFSYQLPTQTCSKMSLLLRNRHHNIPTLYIIRNSLFTFSSSQCISPKPLELILICHWSKLVRRDFENKILYSFFSPMHGSCTVHFDIFF